MFIIELGRLSSFGVSSTWMLGFRLTGTTHSFLWGEQYREGALWQLSIRSCSCFMTFNCIGMYPLVNYRPLNVYFATTLTVCRYNSEFTLHQFSYMQAQCFWHLLLSGYSTLCYKCITSIQALGFNCYEHYHHCDNDSCHGSYLFLYTVFGVNNSSYHVSQVTLFTVAFHMSQWFVCLIVCVCRFLVVNGIWTFAMSMITTITFFSLFVSSKFYSVHY